MKGRSDFSIGCQPKPALVLGPLENVDGGLSDCACHLVKNYGPYNTADLYELLKKRWDSKLTIGRFIGIMAKAVTDKRVKFNGEVFK